MKKRDGMSEGHLKLIRKLPCAVCLVDDGCQPHHLCIKEERGAGMRATDQWAIPLCMECHTRLHTHGSRQHDTILRRWGVDGSLLAEALWNITVTKAKDARLYLMQGAVKGHRW